MLKLYVARHGQDLDNLSGVLKGHRDERLTEDGVKQAHELSTMMREAGLSFDLIYSSPLRRAFETAKIISLQTGSPPPQQEKLLIERDFGIMTGQGIADIERLCAPDILHAGRITYFLSPERAETFPDLMSRARTLLNKLSDQHGSGTILLVTHGDIGMMLFAAYYGLNWKEVLASFHFGNCDLLSLSAENSPDQAHVFRFTATESLDPKGRPGNTY